MHWLLLLWTDTHFILLKSPWNMKVNVKILNIDVPLKMNEFKQNGSQITKHRAQMDSLLNSINTSRTPVILVKFGDTVKLKTPQFQHTSELP